MDCTNLQAIFSGARADDLSDTESAAFEQHLRTCERCREGLALAEEGLEPLVETMDPPAISDAQWDKVTRAVKLEASRPVLTLHAGGSASRAPRALAIAAAFLLAAGLGALMPLEWIPGRSSDVSSKLPGAIDVQPLPPSPAPSDIGQRVVVTALEAGDGVDVSHMYFDCGDEQVLLIAVRDKDL